MFIRKTQMIKNRVKKRVVLKLMYSCKMENNFKVLFSNMACYRQYFDYCTLKQLCHTSTYKEWAVNMGMEIDGDS